VGDGLIKLGKVRYLFLELRERGETFLVHLSLFGNRISVETYVTSPDDTREGKERETIFGGHLPPIGRREREKERMAGPVAEIVVQP